MPTTLPATIAPTRNRDRGGSTTTAPARSTTTGAPTTTTRATPTTLAVVPSAADAPSDALAALNRDRTSQGLPALRVRPDLQAKAQGWADRMARENALYHSKLSDGLATCWTGLGENLARSDSVAGAEQGLMRSSLHLSNILGRWDWVGVGVARTGSEFVVVQVFMSGCL